MLKAFAIVLLGVAIMIMLGAVFYTGLLFIMGSTYWLSQVLGAALIALTFLLAALCGSLAYIGAK
tara:strand:- start:719 stop:913 length:195 start_codon:yes stop_codon:yes gene_type:complete